MKKQTDQILDWRADFITESVNSGKTIYETMLRTGHREHETAQSYVRIK